MINAYDREPAVYVGGHPSGMKLVESGSLDMESLITHRYPLEQINEAFQVALPEATIT